MALDASGVQRSLRKLRKLLKKGWRRPNPEDVHDLRTHTRRFEATVEALGFEGNRNERRVLSRLAKVRKRAGKVRDMDVLTGYAATVAARNPGDCLVELLEHLGSERYRHARRLRAAIRRHGPALRRRLERSARRIEKRIPSDRGRGSDGGPAVPTEAMATALKLSAELAVPVTLSRKTLHPYRLKVKDLRNVLKMATDADRNAFVTRLGEIKDAIGEWHDWETLIAIAEQELPHDARRGLLRELKAIAGRKYDAALALTNRMRKECLAHPRRGLADRSAARKRPAPPVLEATAAIAS